MSKPYRRSAWVARLAMLAVLALAVWGWSSAQAQTTQPQIAHIVPAGGQRGTTVQVSVRGRHLVGATGVRISGEGATGKVISVEHKEPDPKKKRLDASDNPDTAKIEVTIDAKAEPGERQLRVVSPGGVSNLFRFFIGQVPEVNETEPNSTREEAQPLASLPVVANGQIFQADSDFYRFPAKAGQKLVLEVQAQEILPYIADAVPGWFQASLTLYDAAGHELAYVDDFRHHPDPVMFYEVEKDGEYVVEIKDVLYRGRDDFVYRLTIGELPYITHIYPLGAKRGSQAEVQLYGVNLPADKTTVDLQSEAPCRRCVKVTAGGITSNGRLFAVGDLDEGSETEPNNTAEQANKIQYPVTINGRIDTEGDVDYFAFSVEAGQTLVLDVHARRLDSPMDSILNIYDTRGRMLVENDDTKDDSEGLITHHSDSYLLYTFKEAGDYVVAVTDIQGKGGDEYAYRLTVSPPRPDFVLRVQPDSPRAAQGSSALLTIDAFRRDAFEGPIQLSVQGLPEGFTTMNATVPEKETEARMTITAPAGAKIGTILPTVVGKAKIGDQEVVHQAEPCEELMQAFYYMHNVPSQEFLLTVVEAGPFSLSLELPEGGVLKIPRRGRVEVPVKVTFKEGVKKGAIALKPDSPPKGFRIKAPPIPAGQNQTTVEITTLGQQINLGQTGVLILTGSMKDGKETISGFVPAIPFEIVK